MSEIQPVTNADPGDGCHVPEPSSTDDARVRSRERRIDAMLEQSFPASDPPGWTLGVEEDREPSQGRRLPVQ